MIKSDKREKDTIPMREDEKLPVDRIASHLEGKLPDIGSKKPEIRQFWGGAANLTYLLDYGDVEYVLRRPPKGPVAKSAHDMGREYSVLSVLYKEFPYAPRAYYYCEETDIIGAPFFIMERKKGTVIRTEFPDNFKSIPNSARKASTALVDTLVKFHQVDYNELGLSDLGRPDGFITRQIEGWYNRWNKAKLEEYDNPLMDEMYEWLKDNQPENTYNTLVHNDYKLDNVMYSKNDPSDLKAVFDWDMCTLGDPLSDLGALLTYWYQPDDPPYLKQIAMMPTENLGFLTRQEIVNRYSKQVGRKLENINFYHALGLFRLTVIIAQIYIRYVRNQTQDERFAGLGKIIPYVIRASKDAADGEFGIQ